MVRSRWLCVQIWVYVVARARVAQHELHKQFMWGLCDKSMLSGEGGYYLTVYEAALQYISNLDIAAAGASAEPQSHGHHSSSAAPSGPGGNSAVISNHLPSTPAPAAGSSTAVVDSAMSSGPPVLPAWPPAATGHP